MAYNAKNYTEQGGERTVIGGTLVFTDCSKLASLDAIHYRVIHRNQLYNIKAVDFMNFDHKTIKIRCTLEVRQNE